MPVSANITTAGVVAFTLPPGAWGVRIANESDTTIRRLLGAAAATSGDLLGIPIKPGGSEVICFKEVLKNPLAVGAIHAGSGNKTLTYEVITQETQATAGGIEAAQVTLDSTAAVKDNGPAWTPVRQYTAITTATTTDITAAPTGGQKIVLDDCLISCDATCAVSIVEESSGTVFAKVFVPGPGTVQVTLRDGIKAAVADKKLRAITSAAVNTSITACYHSEA
jgi:hypothetical protein